jgi:DNA-binding transcriptional LysR family regulator
MELRHLRYYVAATEEGSIQRAAARLHVAQPSLSRQIRGLEDELGCILFERTTRGVRPTSAGRYFYKEASALLGELDRVCRTVRDRQAKGRHPLRAGLVRTATKFPFVYDSLRAFREDHADQPLVLSRGPSPDLISALKANELDVAIVYEQGLGAHNLSVREIHSETFMLGVAANHRLARLPSVRLADLTDEPFVWLTDGTVPANNNALRAQCRAQGFEPEVVQEVESYEAQLELVSIGIGCALLPASTSLVLPPGRVVLRPILDFAPSLHLNLAWNTESLASGLDEFIECLSSAASRGPRPGQA